MDTLRPTFLEFPYEGKSLSASLQHRRPQLLSFIRKFYGGKKSNFGRRIFKFLLPIRITRKSTFSGKIISSFKIERMSLKLLAIWPKHKIKMQLIYDGRNVHVWEFVFQGLNTGKWSTGKDCDGVAVVKYVKAVMCQKGGTLPLKPSAGLFLIPIKSYK